MKVIVLMAKRTYVVWSKHRENMANRCKVSRLINNEKKTLHRLCYVSFPDFIHLLSAMLINVKRTSFVP